MKLHNRLGLVAFGVVVFLIATPLLVLYARGFTYDWQSHKIVKTGAIVVKTEPTKALVFLDGKIQKGKTPLNIRFLLPKDYDVRIEKDGYSPWTKKLSVAQQFVTWANANRDFVTLFLQAPKLLQTFANTERQVLPDDGALKFFQGPSSVSRQSFKTGNKAYLLDGPTLYVQNDKLEKIYEPVTTVSYDGGLLLISNPNEILIYNPASQNKDLILRSQTAIENPKLNSATGFVFFQNEGKIKAIELDGRDHRNVYNLLDAEKDFVIDKDGKNLFVINDPEIKQYQIR